jgi:cytochrome c-type biogenesis protein CcmH/NrfF
MSARRVGAALVATLLLAAAGTPIASAAAQPHVNFSQVQQDFMCTLCGEALNVARSPQAYSENQTLRGLIAKDLTVTQIKKAMVDDYGPAVLAKPPAHGFSLLVYLIPAAVVLAGLTVVGLTIPRWRRKARARAAEPAAAGPALSDEDAERLDSDLARHL